MRYVFNVPVVFLETKEITHTTILRVLVKTSLGKTVSAYCPLGLAERLKPNMLCTANLTKITDNNYVISVTEIGYKPTEPKRATFADFGIKEYKEE